MNGKTITIASIRRRLEKKGMDAATIAEVEASLLPPPRVVKIKAADVARVGMVLAKYGRCVLVAGKHLRIYDVETFNGVQASCRARRPWSKREREAPTLPLPEAVPPAANLENVPEAA